MTCPKDDILFIYDNSSLIDWIEKFYISIVESNFLINLQKYRKIFELLSILSDIAKYNISLDKEKLMNKFLNIEMKWRGNALSIKNVEIELRKIISELKEEKIEYKILILFSEIKHLSKNQNSDPTFLLYKNDLIEKIFSNILTKFEMKIAINKLENILRLLSKK